MAKMCMGKDLATVYRLLKSAGYRITAFLDNWFRAETDFYALEFEFDSMKYITRVSVC
jgi:hypothetical protein